MRPRLAVLLVLVGALPACTSVLGLDPPTLAPCPDGTCADASADVKDGAVLDGSDGQKCTNDAEAPDAYPAIRCGGGCFGVTYCTTPNPVCCQHTSDAGVTSYGCTASESSCNGYPIVCANDDDCPGQDICCHFNSKMTCDTTSACQSGGQLVCRPGMPIDCPTGKACNVPAVNAGVMSPYELCEP